jgi:hypothetical protein
MFLQLRARFRGPPEAGSLSLVQGWSSEAVLELGCRGVLVVGAGWSALAVVVATLGGEAQALRSPPVRSIPDEFDRGVVARIDTRLTGVESDHRW